jgi:predicted metal-dependent phosphoesterase TrpH
MHSGPTTLPLLGRFARDCYSDPLALYEAARRRGMDLVTITDHDSIEGALAIAHLPGTVVSEEITCVLPSGRRLHVNAFAIDERQHERIARLRFDPPALFAFLREERIAASISHAFSAVTGPRELADILLALSGVGLVEVRNGMMPERINAWAEEACRAHRLAAVAGSDAHTVAAVAHAWTEVEGALDVESFLAGVRAGRGRAAGGHGRWLRTTADVLRHVRGAWLDLAPLHRRSLADLGRFAALVLAGAASPLAPAITAALQVRDVALADRIGLGWRAAFRAADQPGGSPAREPA